MHYPPFCPEHMSVPFVLCCPTLFITSLETQPLSFCNESVQWPQGINVFAPLKMSALWHRGLNWQPRVASALVLFFLFGPPAF